tara:strand:- start:2514 stop:2876 length:363 start_codon:yes stop_codon:yes gene_type:complete
MEYNETDALLEEKIDRKLEEEIQKEEKQNASSSDVDTLNKTLLKLLQDGNIITKPSFYKLTGSMTLPQRIFDVKKMLGNNLRIMSMRGKHNLSHYWLEKKTKNEGLLSHIEHFEYSWEKV